MRKLALVALVVVLGVAMGGSVASSDNDNSRNAVMWMESVWPDEWLADARAHVNLIAYYDDHANPNWGDGSWQVWFNVKDLPCLGATPGVWSSAMYALYVWTPTNGIHRLQSFNTNCQTGMHSSWVVDGEGDVLGTILTDDWVRLGVAIEVEDSHEWPDNARVMYGELQR